MPDVAALGALARRTAVTLGVFRGSDAGELGISPNQLSALTRAGVVIRVHPGVYRMASVPPSPEQGVRAALMWAGPLAVAAGRSAGALYTLEGVHATRPEIVVPPSIRARSRSVSVHHAADRGLLMVRSVRGIPTTGVEATLLLLAHLLDATELEVACEDARRRGLTALPALRAYLHRARRRGRPGLVALRALITELDPVHPARSKLEVLTRRLLVSHGLTRFVREFPLASGSRRFLYDFAFVSERVIIEVNGRRWHADPTDFDRDQEKWSVPAQHGFRVLFATWDSVTRHPDALVAEVRAALAA